jgi:hypothetical protein
MFNIRTISGGSIKGTFTFTHKGYDITCSNNSYPQIAIWEGASALRIGVESIAEAIYWIDKGCPNEN